MQRISWAAVDLSLPGFLCHNQTILQRKFVSCHFVLLLIVFTNSKLDLCLVRPVAVQVGDVSLSTGGCGDNGGPSLEMMFQLNGQGDGTGNN
jgi:hypothetical protein